MECETLLHQAEELSQKYSFEIAKLEPPAPSPKTEECLDRASTWFSLDLASLKSPAFETLDNEDFWDSLKELKVDGIYLPGLKKGGQFRTGIEIDPQWGSGWEDVALWMGKKKITLIGDALGNSTGLSTDFGLALKNYAPYPSLYHLIEIASRDWKWLPDVANDQLFANIPWLKLQELHKKGYIPQAFSSYTRQTLWNATGKIQCIDGKVRRWIYLQASHGDPLIDWLNPSFAGSRVAAADTLDSVYRLGQQITQFDDSVVLGTQTLWTRKLGGYSVLKTDRGLEGWKEAPTDLILDQVTQRAVLHAFIAEDAEALKLIYSAILSQNIPIKRLVHSLEPLDQCSWKFFLSQPKKEFKYHDEILTAEALRIRLLKEDIYQLDKNTFPTWPSYCMGIIDQKDFQQKRSEVMKIHLLSAFFYAMQPGVFSFSIADLLGILSPDTIDLTGPNEKSLYGSFSSQMKNSLSFASQLKNILAIRASSGIDRAELIEIAQTRQKHLLLFIYRHPGSQMLQLLGVNFGKIAAEQTLEIPEIRQTTAIDLMSGLALKKPLDSATIRVQIPPLSGQVIYFQKKQYD